MCNKFCVKCGSQMVYSEVWRCEPCLTEIISIKRKMLEEASSKQAIVSGTKMRKCDHCQEPFMFLTIVADGTSLKYLCTNCLKQLNIKEESGIILSIEDSNGEMEAIN